MQKKTSKSGLLCRETRTDAKEAFIVWRCEVTSWWMAVVKPLATIALAASAARGFVAFAAWRKSFRDRLIGGEPYSDEVA